MPTYRLDLEYEGTRFQGWQEQKGVRTVAGTLRQALEARFGPIRELMGAGRTDRGVHALHQVAHLRLAEPLGDLERRRREVNELVPPDLHLLALTSAADPFHARHDAVQRSYLYQIVLRRSAFARRHSWWVKRPLDPQRLARGLALLPGRHDFAAFCERPAESMSTIVQLDRAEWRQEGAALLVRLAASHFLWKMVRRVIGALVRIGSGEWSPAALEALLSAHPPARLVASVAESTAPPAGLFLERVLYPGESELAPLHAVLPVAAESFPAVSGSRPARRSSSRQPGRWRPA